jgi:hypothetical protein
MQYYLDIPPPYLISTIFFTSTIVPAVSLYV